MPFHGFQQHGPKAHHYKSKSADAAKLLVHTWAFSCNVAIHRAEDPGRKKAFRIRYFGQRNKNMAMIRSGVHRYVITGPTNRQIKSWDSHPVENIQHPSKTDANERESTNDSRSFSLTPNFNFRWVKCEREAVFESREIEKRPRQRSESRHPSSLGSISSYGRLKKRW